MSEFFIEKDELLRNADYNYGGDVIPEVAFMEWNEDTYDVLGSVFLKEMNTKVSQQGEMRVNENECRFDNIAYKALGNPNFWWFMMEYNEHIDWNIPADHIIKIPSINDIIVLKDQMIVKQNLRDKIQ